MGKILRGLSNESVLLKSLAEHDNLDKESRAALACLNKNCRAILQVTTVIC